MPRRDAVYRAVAQLLKACVGLLLVVASTGVAFGQELLWAKRAGGSQSDQWSDIAVDAAGNSYVIGSFAGAATFDGGEIEASTLTSAGETDVFIAKYNSTGALLWVKQAGEQVRTGPAASRSMHPETAM